MLAELTKRVGRTQVVARVRWPLRSTIGVSLGPEKAVAASGGSPNNQGMDSSVKPGSMSSRNGCSRVFVLWVSGVGSAALDIMRSAGVEPTVG